jgi:hypothetical protein
MGCSDLRGTERSRRADRVDAGGIVERHESQVDRARGRVNEARQRLKHPVRAGIDLHDERLVTWQCWRADSIA